MDKSIYTEKKYIFIKNLLVNYYKIKPLEYVKKYNRFYRYKIF